MSTVTIVDIALAVVVGIAWPLFDARRSHARFLAALASGRPDARVRAYRRTILVQWCLALVVLTWTLASHRPVARLGLRAPAGSGVIWAVLASVLVLALQAMQLRSAWRSPAMRERLRVRFADLGRFLPHTATEMRMFAGLAATAGCCEELVFRGFLPAALAPVIGMPVAIVLAIGSFALGHAYQGRRGILTAGLAAAVMVALYLATGSLLVPVLVHAGTDVLNGALLYTALSENGSSPSVAAA